MIKNKWYIPLENGSVYVLVPYTVQKYTSETADRLLLTVHC